jgi:hypothetical protein
MFQVILFYLTIPLKLSIIFLFSIFHKTVITLTWEKVEYEKNIPDYVQLQREMKLLIDEIPIRKTESGYLYKMENEDHLALRHAALVWSNPQPAFINSIDEFMDKREFKRNKLTTKDTPPAIPISVAFIIAVSIRNNIRLNNAIKQLYLESVNKLMADDFRLSGYGGVSISWKSTAFDYVYVSSVLLTAYSISKDQKYLTRLKKYRHLRPLLLAPHTHFTDRRYFLEHIYMMALYAMCQCDPEDSLVIYATNWVYRESRFSANPFFAALAHECGILTDPQVLYAHADASPLKASQLHQVRYLKKYPFSWQYVNNQEFKFDELKGKPTLTSDVDSINHLDGIVLARSIISILQ